MKLSEIKKHPPKIILAGEPGSGKTAFALTLGEGTTVIDLDDGLLTGQTFKDQFFARRQQVEVKWCKEEDPGKALAFGKALSYIRGISDECLKGKPPCRAVVVDGLTVLAEMCMRSILGNANMLGKHPQLQHWGLRDLEMNNFLTTLYSLPMVVVLVTHLQQTEEEGGNTVYKIALQGKALPPQLAPKFDEIWLAKTRRGAGGKTDYTIETQGSVMFTTRSRANLPSPQDMNLGLPALLVKMGFEWA